MSHADPSLDSLASINADGSRNFIYPADVHGTFYLARRILAWFLLGVFFIIPWIPINGHPAVFFDFFQHQLYILGWTFAPQDFWLAFFFITGFGASLIAITSVLGRVWCGWTCPHTLALDHIYRVIERLIDGPALERRKLTKAHWTPVKTTKRVLKHALFVLVSLALSFTFFSYLHSVSGLAERLSSPFTNPGTVCAFLFLAGILYFDFSWFREQFCIILCPYGRIQSALIDDHSIVIGYDKNRGEPRGKIHDPGVGHCIDCHRCIQVCPTGIDIRQGLQMECIGCANCIDACNEVMTKIHRPTNLISYTSLTALNGGKTKIIRPRTIFYVILMFIGLCVGSFNVSQYQTASISITRPPGPPFFITDGVVRNQFLLRLKNKENATRTFSISVVSDNPGLKNLDTDLKLKLDPWAEDLHPLILVIDQSSFKKQLPVKIIVRSEDGRTEVSRDLIFLGPAN